MTNRLCLAIMALALLLMPAVSAAGAVPNVDSQDGPALKQRRARRRNARVVHGIGDAFRTAGNAVAYGVHSTGRVLTRGQRQDREAERAEHYQRRMERSGRATRRGMGGRR